MSVKGPHFVCEKTEIPQFLWPKNVKKTDLLEHLCQMLGLHLSKGQTCYVVRYNQVYLIKDTTQQNNSILLSTHNFNYPKQKL